MPRITIRKLASSISVALSLGRRAWKRITPSALLLHPAMITSPSTSSAFAKIEPMIERPRDHDLAGRQREDDDEELGQVSERRLEHARDRRAEALADLLGREGDDPGQSGEGDGVASTKVSRAGAPRSGPLRRRP